MKALDKYLQRVRIQKARNFIQKNDSVLDIGSVDGIMFESWKGHISKGVGVDPTLKEPIKTELYSLYPGYFPEACPKGETFNAITLLAVLEHIPTTQQKELAKNCFEYLKPKGKLIITVPSPQVDTILEILLKLGLIEGMSLEEHYGYKPGDTESIFTSPYFKLLHKEKFQLGLNNLFVFERI
ncbi:MAG: class I SAM-dependent methyltransferase [Bacteroidia bacterium]|nr:class I SAM-dependent methyltransferase [Bacteroidia bacterium]MCF8426251.1 class I SAM-dependent methyltransferase [Bacteroidia bacterium]MCF8445456.1 class I SAM-dependent methyltransferase [Bacteroidia bacterium]